MIRIRFDAALGFTVLVLGVTAIGPTASADTSRVAPTSDDSLGRLALVLDSSGSMKEPARGGHTKIEAAKQALHRVIDGLPSDADVGLRVYGATVFSSSDPGACRDSQLVVPLGTDNRDELSRAVDRYRPYGETPIGHSLREAGKDLGSEGRRSIILVSDGEDTCAPPSPCQVARELAEQGVELTIDVVGLDVSGRARAQLQCIAQAGRGTYYDADDAESLANALEQTSTRAFRPLSLAGEPIRGTRTPQAAPEAAAGQYLDTFPATGKGKYYVLSRSEAGSTFHVGAASPIGAWVTSIDMEISTLEGDVCGWASGSILNSGFPASAVTSWSDDPGCRNDEQLLLRLEHGTLASVRPDTPLQLVVIEEPPVATVEGLPAESDLLPSWQPISPDATSETLVPGTGFDNAPEVTDGRYDSSILPGEIQLYKVHLDWGQRLQAEVRWHDIPLDSVDLLGTQIRLIGPTHGDASSDVTGSGAPASDALIGEGELMGATTPLVRFLNRNRSDPEDQASAIPGAYYIAVTVDADSGLAGELLPYSLSVQTVGEAGDGAPQYAGDRELTMPTTPETGPDADPNESDDAETASGEDSSDDDTTLRNVAYGLTGVGAVLLLLAGALVLMARSRN
jgi:Ca-activated chloride channel homolog